MKYIYVIFVVIFSNIFFSSCNENGFQNEWEVIYRNDADGNKLFGSKEKLIEAVRNGNPIRVGFGGRRKNDTLISVEHVTDAQFLTITNGKEVFAQITPIFGQRPDLVSDTIKIEIKEENKWVVLIGTNGERSTLSKYFDSDISQKSKQSRRGATWYAKLPMNELQKNVKPLWD